MEASISPKHQESAVPCGPPEASGGRPGMIRPPAGQIQESPMTNGSAQEQTVGLFTASAVAQPGLTLVSTLFGHDSWLLDNAGQVVNSWTSGHVGAGAAYLLDNGGLVRSGVAYRNAHVGK